MDIVHRAEEVLQVGDIKQATALMTRALALAPRDASVLTAFGSMLAEVGNEQKAVLTLRKAAQIEPDTGYEKYMCASMICMVCICSAAAAPGQRQAPFKYD